MLVAQALLAEFQYWRFRWVSWKRDGLLAPGWQADPLKPSSWRGGSPEAAGSVT